MKSGFFGGFPAIFSVLFVLTFGMVLFMFGFAFVRGWKHEKQNRKAPQLTVEAKVVAKRMNVTHGHHRTGDSTMHMSSSTWYYVTFEVESGDRLELTVDGTEYGLLVEGDSGRLTFKGTRFIGFER